jgi:hypothetical protein
VPSNTCAVTLTATSQETCRGTWITHTTTCPVATAPLLAINVNCPANPVSPVGPITYSGSVSNAGNITLTNILVFSSQPTNRTLLLGPVTLAPAASASFSGSYTPVGGANPTTNLITATGLDICQARPMNAGASCLVLVAPVGFAQVVGAPTVAGGSINLSFPTEKGKYYTVQQKNSLKDPTWTDLTTVVGTGGSMTITDALAAQEPTRFYRIIVTP